MVFDFKFDRRHCCLVKSLVLESENPDLNSSLKSSGSSRKLLNFLGLPSPASGDMIIPAVLISQGCHEHVLECLWKYFFKALCRLAASWNQSPGIFKDREWRAYLIWEPFSGGSGFPFLDHKPLLRDAAKAGTTTTQPSPGRVRTEARESWFVVRAHSCFYKSSLMCLSEKFAFLKVSVSRQFSLFVWNMSGGSQLILSGQAGWRGNCKHP